MTQPEIGYAEAMKELDAILADIEEPDVDIDVLSEKVRRAAELIELCRTRIAATRFEVDEIVAGLADADG